MGQPARGVGPLLVLLSSLALPAAGCAHRAGSERPWLRNVEFSGADKVPAAELRKGLANQETSWFTVLRKRLFAPSALDEDRQRIVSTYASHGFFDARVVGTEVRPRWRNSVDLRFTVDEGPESRVSEVEVRGLSALGDRARALVTDLGLAVGDRFDHERYQAAKGTLLARLREAGHPFAAVEGRVEVDRDGHRVVVHLDATPGAEARFGPIVVEGGSVVPARLIALEADIPEGAPFSPGPLEIARGRLLNLGVFSLVRVEPQAVPERPDLAAVKITVSDEPRRRQLRLGVGLGIEAQRTEAHLRLPVTWNNFLGGLRRLDLRIDAGYVALPAFWTPTRHGPQATLEARLTQPHFPFDRAQSRIAIGLDVGIDYAYRSLGPRLELGTTYGLLRNHIRFGLAYSFQFLTFFDLPPDPTGMGDIFSNPDKARLYGYTNPYRIAWVQEQVTLDWRDQPLGTRRGVFLELTGEQGGPWFGGAYQYEAITVDGRGFVPLGSRVVLAARARFGHLFTQGVLNSPITRRFYGGGPSSHRGFNFNRLGPQIASGTQNGSSPGDPVPVGGDELLLGQAELRVDLFRLFGSWVGVVGFCDAGNVVAAGQRAWEPSTGGLHVAVGGGLRYNTVIGSIRVDVGARVNNRDKAPDPGSWGAFHISIGEAF